MRMLRKMTRDRSGATIAEFAMISVALITLIAFLIEGSFQLLTEAALYYGLREATRFGTTGEACPPSMSGSCPASREAAISQIMASSVVNLINSSYLTVTLTSYPAFSAVGVSGQGTSGAGGAGAVVQYQISYYQPWLLSGSNYFPAAATGLSGIQHTLSALVQNEDFPAS